MSTGNKDIRIPDVLASQITLREDEEVLGVIRFNWLNYLSQLGTGALFVLLGVYLILFPRLSYDNRLILQDGFPIGVGGLILGLLLFISIYVTKQRSGFVITDQRVVKSRGRLLSTRTKAVLMSEIRSIETIQSGPLRLSPRKKGALQIDTGGGELTVPARDAQQLTKLIRTQIDRLESA